MPEAEKHPRVLVVDDEPYTLETLKVILEAGGCLVDAAPSGRAAQDLVRGEEPDAFECALIDYRMPGLSGLDLLAWLKRTDPALAGIILTAEGEKELVARSLHTGASDFLEKPASPGEIRRAVDRAVKITRENRYLKMAASEVQAIGLVQEKIKQTGLAVEAREDRLPGAPSLEVRFFPVKETGGDFVSYRFLPGSQLFLLGGDVSGHDLRAGFVAAFFQGIVRGMMEMDAGSGQICQFFNTILTREWNASLDPGQIGTSLSVCLLRIDFERRAFRMQNNGFPLPALAGPSGEVIFPGRSGPPLGWFENMEFIQEQFQLPADGHCYLWCDGLEDLAENMGISPFALAYRLLHEPRREDQQKVVRERKDDILLCRVDWRNESPRNTAEPVYYGICHETRNEDAGIWETRMERSLAAALPKLDMQVRREFLSCCREAAAAGPPNGGSEPASRQRLCQISADTEGNRLLLIIRSLNGSAVFSQSLETLRRIHGQACSAEVRDGGGSLKISFQTEPGALL